MVKQFVLVGVVSGFVLMSSLAVAATYGGGSGTASDPYQIWTAGQMNSIGANVGDWSRHFRLMADIDMAAYTGTQYRIIGNAGTPFTGTFDGNSRTISNLTYKTSGYVDYVGVFGHVSGGSILNLVVTNAQLSSEGQYVGGIVGLNAGTLSGCMVSGSICGYYYVGGVVGQNPGVIHDCEATASAAGTDYIGGLTGYNKNGTITDSFAMGNVTGIRCVGGLAGGAYYGTIKSSFASGVVVGYRNVGGLVGYNLNGSISNCYAVGATKGTADSFTRVGGLVGANDGTVAMCFSAGTVTGAAQAGGLIGANLYGAVSASFWDTQTTGRSVGIGGGTLTGATGLTTAAMKTVSPFVSAGWDFTTSDGDAADWQVPNKAYPRLIWESYGGGRGTVEDPYQIWTAVQMNGVGENTANWNKHFRLMANIDMSAYAGTQYRIIGTAAVPFTGSFDGNGYVISNLTYETTDAVDNVGLFGYIKNGSVKKLALNSVRISSGGQFVGGLAGQNAGTLDDCQVTGSVSGYYYVGGIAGQNSGQLTRGEADVSVRGTDYIGGLTGYNKSGAISTCFAVGSVTGARCVGGLAGGVFEGSIRSSYAAGAVNGYRNVGGLVGYNLYGMISICYAGGPTQGTADTYTRVGGLIGGNDGTIAGCYARGLVAGAAQAGGLVGANDSGSISASFWDVVTSRQSSGTGDGSKGNVTGLTTAEMMKVAHYVAAGWDFTDTDGDAADWRMVSNDYPRLFWQPYNEDNSGYGGGSGTAQDPYRIYTAEQMNAIGANSADWNKHFKLMADIDMSIYTGTQYRIIGNAVNEFTGSFDGSGHTIYNLSFTTTAAVDYVGVFGYVRNASIWNLGLKNITLSSGGQYVGGLAGYSWGGSMTACYVTGSVRGVTWVGGLVGYNKAGTLTACYGTDAVSGTTYVGGLIGGNEGTLKDCYAVGVVGGTSRVGGLAGTNLVGVFAGCFWNTQTSGRSNAVGEGTAAGIKGVSNEAMMTLSTFTSVKWDFINTWGIGNGQTYPYLKPLTGLNPADIDYNGVVDMEDLAIVQANWLKQQEAIKAAE